MADSCMKGSGLVWLILIIIVIVIIILLVFWAWPWSTNSSYNTGNGNQSEVFRVTVAKKNKSHPSFGKGSDWAYVINDVQGKSLVLKVGKQYRFVVSCEDHPFYLSVNEKGGNSDASSSDSNYVKRDGLAGQIDITGTPICTGSFNINVYKDMPRILYYTCAKEEYMGGSIIIEE